MNPKDLRKLIDSKELCALRPIAQAASVKLLECQLIDAQIAQDNPKVLDFYFKNDEKLKQALKAYHLDLPISIGLKTAFRTYEDLKQMTFAVKYK